MNPTTYTERMADHEGGQHPERDPNCERCAQRPAVDVPLDIVPTWAGIVPSLLDAVRAGSISASMELERMALVADLAVEQKGRPEGG